MRIFSIIKIRNIIIAVLLILITASCNFAKEQAHFGKPTTMPNGSTPLDIIVQIQKEFLLIKKPILKI